MTVKIHSQPAELAVDGAVRCRAEGPSFTSENSNPLSMACTIDTCMILSSSSSVLHHNTSVICVPIYLSNCPPSYLDTASHCPAVSSQQIQPTSPKLDER